jgi:DNA-directed RNA polymerase specialized sigma24 family protein
MERTPMPQELGAPPEAVRAHGAALRALARALLGDSAAADDAVQDTWVR